MPWTMVHQQQPFWIIEHGLTVNGQYFTLPHLLWRTPVYVTKSNKFVTYCSPPESSGVQQNLVESGGIRWSLAESGGIRWTEFELSHV